MSRSDAERLTLLEVGLRRVERLVQGLVDGRERPAEAGVPSPPPEGWWWHCPGCRSKLGYWLPKVRTLNIQRSDLRVSVLVAPDTGVTVTCPRCSTDHRFDPDALGNG